MKPRNTRVQWPLSSPGTSWVPSDWRSENAGSSRGCGNSETVSIAGPAGACPAKNFCEASRPRPAARATTRMIRVVRLNMAERSEEHTSELQSLMRISYAVFCLKKKKKEKTREKD